MTALAAAAVLALGACAQQPPERPIDPDGPVSAPITIEGERGLVRRSLTIAVTFEADARDVDVRIYGLDGLVVTTSVPARGASYRKGDRMDIPVRFTRGSGRSQLVVVVAASYGPDVEPGRPAARLGRQRVYTFG